MQSYDELLLILYPIYNKKTTGVLIKTNPSPYKIVSQNSKVRKKHKH